MLTTVLKGPSGCVMRVRGLDFVEVESTAGVITTTFDGRNHMTSFQDQSAAHSEHARPRHAIDCAGARVRVHARSLATLLRVTGEVDASNADLVSRAIRRFSQLDTPLIVDLSSVEFLGIAGFRTLFGLHCIVVAGPALRRLTSVITDHGVPIVDSVPEALHLIEEDIHARRQLLSADGRHASRHRPRSA